MTRFLGAKGANQPAIVLAIITLALAALLAWCGYENGWRLLYAGAGVLVVVAILIPQALKIADQWERAVVLRLGRLVGIRGPGLFLIVPFIDQVSIWLDQRIQT